MVKKGMAKKGRKKTRYVRWGLTAAAVGLIGWQMAEVYLQRYAAKAAALELVSFFGAVGQLPPEAQALWLFKSTGLAVTLGGLALAGWGLVKGR